MARRAQQAMPGDQRAAAGAAWRGPAFCPLRLRLRPDGDLALERHCLVRRLTAKAPAVTAVAATQDVHDDAAGHKKSVHRPWPGTPAASHDRRIRRQQSAASTEVEPRTIANDGYRFILAERAAARPSYSATGNNSPRQLKT